MFEPPSELLALKEFDTAGIREALRDPTIERVALVSGAHDERKNRAVAFQRSSGQWHELRGFVKILPGVENRVWMTRRRNKAQRAIRALVHSGMPSNNECTPKVEKDLGDISEFITEHLPLSAINLPRGYRIGVNLDGQRSLELDGALFDPTAREPQPSTAAIGRLKADLATGWLSELAESWPEFPRLKTSPDAQTERIARRANA